jgi:hypothetical protein
VSDSWNSLFAFVRVAEASASARDDSVPHFAAENPDQAATMVTIERRSASPIAIAVVPAVTAGVLGVLADLLADLGRRESFAHL